MKHVSLRRIEGANVTPMTFGTTLTYLLHLSPNNGAVRGESNIKFWAGEEKDQCLKRFATEPPQTSETCSTEHITSNNVRGIVGRGLVFDVGRSD